MSSPAIAATALSKTYRLGAAASGYATLRDSVAGWLRPRPAAREADELKALDDVSFEIQPGEVVGFVGRNGAGKSTLLKILARITEPSAGRAIVRGRLGALLEVGTGFHPELTGRENVYLSGAILGMRRADVARRFDEIVAFAELERFVETPVKHYSSGMYMRLAFAVAAHLEPEILLVDEVLAVGDAAFQRKCLGKMSDVRADGRTVLFVSHNLAAVASLCPRTIVLHGGRVLADDATSVAIARYLSVLELVAATDLGQRRDRSGDGRLRFTGWAPLSAEGTPVASVAAGGALQIELSVAVSGGRPLDDVHVSLWFRGPNDEPLFYLTTLVRQALVLATGDSRVVCEVSSLPLRPGKYRFDAICAVGDTLADKVDRAGTLEVVAGDFFGTGRLPPEGAGPLLVPHRFRSEPHA